MKTLPTLAFGFLLLLSGRPAIAATTATGDEALVMAMTARQSVPFIEARNLVVLRVLKEDDYGIRHQKLLVRLSNGVEMRVISNMGLCPRFPVQPGDILGVGGEFIWDSGSGFMHWVHRDPKNRRPHGYVTVNGQSVCP